MVGRTLNATHRVILAGCLLIAACSSQTAATPGPSATARVFTVGGDRDVTVNVPLGLDAAVPAPVLISLHGFGSNGHDMEVSTKLGAVADARGIVYLLPDGTRNGNNDTFWNATDACCDMDGSDVDDSSYLAGLIDEIATHVAVDTQRVYIVGHSNGAFMSYRMACDHADAIAAIVSIAGASFKDPADCQPSEPVSILQIHGTADDNVRPEGGNAQGVLPSGKNQLADYPSTLATLEAWAAYDGCSGELTPTGRTLDLERTLEGTTGPNETTVSAFEGCPAGGSVELWQIAGGSHFPQWTPTFAETLIDYLLAHPKP